MLPFLRKSNSTFGNSTSSLFTSNTGPLALRVIKMDSDRIDLYLLSKTDFTLTTTDNVSTGVDQARVKVIQRFNRITKQFDKAR